MKSTSTSKSSIINQLMDTRDIKLRESTLVIAVSLVMVAVPFVWVHSYSTAIPYYDDWGFIEHVVGIEPNTLDYLVESAKGHCVPITKGLAYPLWKLGGGVHRFDSYLNCLTLAIAVAFVLRSVRNVRGKLCLEDTFLPLAMTNLWGLSIHLQLYLSSYTFIHLLYCSALLWFVTLREKDTKSVIAISAFTVILPLQGGPGIASSPPLAFCIFWEAILKLRGKESNSKLHGISLLLSAAVCTMITVFVLTKIKGESGAGIFDPLEIAVVAINVAAQGIGVVASKAWPASGIGLAFLFCLASCASGWIGLSTKDRQRKISLILVLFGFFLVAIAAALARGVAGMNQPRFITMSVPIFVGCYVMLADARNSRYSSLTLKALFFASCFYGAYHVSEGMSAGKVHRERAGHLTKDIHDGLSLPHLAAKHMDYWCYSEEAFEEKMRKLRDFGIAPFASIKNDPAFSQIDFNSQVRMLEESDDYSLLEFDLTNQENAKAIRIQLRARQGAANSSLILRKAWPGSSSRDASTTQSLKLNPYGPLQRTRTFWIAENPEKYLLIVPKNDHAISVTDVTLLCTVETNADQ